MEKNINKIYPMLDGGPIFRLSDFKALKHRVLLKIKRSEGNADTIDVSDNQKDSRFDFDEYPDCESCGMSGAKFVLKAIDGNRIVECENCGLWYTSPRVKESEWISWLQQDNERNREFTENRLQYGVALERNKRYSLSFWWRVTRKKRQQQLKKIFKLHGGKIDRLFDVGCGCGYLLKAAQDMGVYAAGNDLNRYAVDRMRELFGFDVYTGLIYDLLVRGDVKKDDFDIVYMNDYIEHSFHPKKDLKAAFEMLKKNGVAYLTTFCIDSERFDKLGEKWDMLMWNHCFHFTSETLKKIMQDVGFEIIMCNIHSSGGMVEICGRKI
jgi:2-polyprenyl-3-methyl-5-hydroxy-6-metoxy-1,4-benzoquinol methylase